ncbi:hypothetical protein [Shewanella surugensis]|uniref:Uncharacterized protein n=1 Tax=Shewanella surugensis TaxID=212020 RepID=A0ABT0L7V4_9GAMM|nr:hypothetical protein [Shewanella surugensis]MCL1123781.1 hypothetical protein [Shewanella surugensis]
MESQCIKKTFRSQIYSGTIRDYWLYVPAQYEENTPANLMVFQDGYYNIDESKPMQAVQVIDRLMVAKKIPTTGCVFINPGIIEKPTKPEHHPDPQRSIEYDPVNDQYSQFLINELLPEAFL